MHEFGSSGLVTGYIKQLLATFELPTARVYTEDFDRYFERHHIESPYVIESFDGLDTNIPNLGEADYDNLTKAQSLQVDEKLLVPYLKDGKVQFLLGGYYTSDNTFVPGKWQSMDLDANKSQGGVWNIYNRGATYLNHTKKLQLRNNVYDSYTHEYLGNYLRFLRDYDNLDLMSLYNCFSNKLCSTASGLDIKVIEGDSKYGYFNALDPNYKIYLIPVKLFKNYTIAIESAAPVEMCCGIYNNKLNIIKDEYKELLKRTYKRVPMARFNYPFLYSALSELAPKTLSKFPSLAEIEQHSKDRKFLARIADREPNLVLMLKVHKDVASTIVILEGNYLNWNDTASDFILNTNINDFKEKKITLQHNHTVLTNEAIYSDLPLALIAPLQLLQLNTGKQIPFADKLLEYLLDMCITGGQDEPRENVLMAQYLLGLRHSGNTIPTKYYIAKSKSKTKDISKLIYANRTFCQNTGDYFLNYEKVGEERKPIIYCYNKDQADNCLGSFTEWLNREGLDCDFDYFLSTPLPLEFNFLNGVWSPAMRKLFYRFMMNNTTHNFSVHRDVLGYVDKDVEKYFVALQENAAAGKPIRKSMLNFNVWEDLD
jgi:hypothetical protein